MISRSPGMPKSPQIEAVTTFIATENPAEAKIVLKAKSKKPPKTELMHSHKIPFNGFTNILKMIIAIKRASK